jgi:hypothetical protein
VPLSFYKDRASAVLSQAKKATAAEADGAADDAASPSIEGDQGDEGGGFLATYIDAASATASPVDVVRRFSSGRLGPGATTVVYLAGPAASQVCGNPSKSC